MQILTSIWNWLTEPIGCFLFLAVLLVAVAQVIVGSLHRWFYGKIAKLVHPNDEVKRGERLQKRRDENLFRRATGITEVLTYYVVFLFTRQYVFAFFIGWLGIKIALGWQRQKVSDDEYLLKASMVSLPLNLINLLLGIGAGWLFKYLTKGG